jgi:D-alanine-D-alanine ligase
MQKIRLGILCGGRSAEHEVSLQSARSIIDALDRERFEPVVIGIEKSGRWLLERAEGFLVNAKDPRTIALDPGGIPVCLPPASAGSLIRVDGGGEAARIDAAFPILHGPYGEDGVVQGLLKLAGVPFAGSGVLASAAGMDKDITKRLLRDAGVRIGAFLTAFRAGPCPTFDSAAARLGTPLFVKPANMGSSIGVFKVHNEDEWRGALLAAFSYDTKIIIEENIAGREIECGVLERAGNGVTEYVASPPGEIKPAYEFYSYKAKYLDDKGAALEIPARLDAALEADIKRLAIQTFTTLGCEGLARVDFFLTERGEIFVNEINTLPGFTAISMYPKLFAQAGVSYSELITLIVDAARARFEREKELKISGGEMTA